MAATEGPVLVVAGAGSGKTRVLTYRVAHLIRDLGVAPWEVLAITFTNKAAGEMKERVRRLVGPRAKGMWVSTFHSACVRILRREAPRLGYSSQFTIYDAQDSLRAINRVIRDLRLDPKSFQPRAIRAKISNAKNELVDYESFAEQGGNFRHEIEADIYRLYQEQLLKNSAMDFDDLLMVATEVFDAFPDVLEYYRERFRYLHVDEFQDTNRAQYVLVRQLAGKRANICAVGDSDQSIYAFRGADIRNHPQLRAGLPPGPGGGARPELSLHPDHPGSRQRRDRPQRAPPAKAAVERPRPRRSHLALYRRGRSRRGRVRSRGNQEAVERGLRPVADGGFLPGQRPEPGRGGKFCPLRRVLPGDRHGAVLRAARDQGCAGLSAGAGQPGRRGVGAPDRQPTPAGDRRT